MEITLKQLRKQAGKTAREVSEALGVGIQAVYKYERGLCQINLRQVLTLANLYEFPVEDIIHAQLNSCQSAR